MNGLKSYVTSIEKNSQEFFFQVSASPDQIDSETFSQGISTTQLR